MDITLSITHPSALIGLNRAAEASGKTTEALVQEAATSAVNAIAGQFIVTQMDTTTFLGTRFTGEERAAIRGAALTNGMVADLCAMLDRTDIIHFDNPLAIEGLAKLEAAGLLAAGRAAQILAP